MHIVYHCHVYHVYCTFYYTTHTELAYIGDLRLGSKGSCGGMYDTVYYRHWGCVTLKVIENIGYAENLNGFASLTDADQARVRHTFAHPPPPAERKPRVKKAKIQAED